MQPDVLSYGGIWRRQSNSGVDVVSYSSKCFKCPNICIEGHRRRSLVSPQTTLLSFSKYSSTFKLVVSDSLRLKCLVDVLPFCVLSVVLSWILSNVFVEQAKDKTNLFKASLFGEW